MPIRDCYRVADRLLAGEYPGSSDRELAARRLRAFERCGVTLAAIIKGVQASGCHIVSEFVYRDAGVKADEKEDR